jgi:hypothetical protein
VRVKARWTFRCGGRDVIGMKTRVQITGSGLTGYSYTRSCDLKDPGKRSNGVMNCGVADYFDCNPGKTYTLSMVGTLRYVSTPNPGGRGFVKMKNETYSREVKYNCRRL